MNEEARVRELVILAEESVDIMMAECSAECTRLLAVAKAQGEQEMAEAGEMAVKMTISAKLEEAKIQDLIIEAKSKLAKIESEILEKSKKLIG